MLQNNFASEWAHLIQGKSFNQNHTMTPASWVQLQRQGGPQRDDSQAE